MSSLFIGLLSNSMSGGLSRQRQHDLSFRTCHNLKLPDDFRTVSFNFCKNPVRANKHYFYILQMNFCYNIDS